MKPRKAITPPNFDKPYVPGQTSLGRFSPGADYVGSSQRAETYLVSIGAIVTRPYDLFIDLADYSPALIKDVQADLEQELATTLRFANRLIAAWIVKWPKLKVPPSLAHAWPEVNPVPPKAFQLWLEKQKKTVVKVSKKPVASVAKKSKKKR